MSETTLYTGPEHVLALLDTFHQLHRGRHAFLHIIADVAIRGVAGHQAAVYGIEMQLRHVVFIHEDLPAIVHLAEVDLGLDEEFVEFGSSGVVYDRESVISAMVLEDPVSWSIASFKALPLAQDVALVTYLTAKAAGQPSLRCSVWKRTGSQWRIVFHQGTRAQK